MNQMNECSRALETTTLAVVALMAAQAVHAVTATSDPERLEEVIVTAQKREQNLQDVGLSVTALDQSALQTIGHQDITALTMRIPSLQVNQFSPNVVVFNIRGVAQNDFTDIQESPIAFYNDEVYVAALGALSGQTFDLQRVEVLRGPQGTLFGRNATGGLIQVVTAKPTREFQAYATLTRGRFDEIASEAAVSGPLGAGVRGRLALSTDDHDGYVHNLIGPDRSDRKFYAGRGQLQFDVGEHGELLTKFEYLRNDHEVSGAYSHQAAGFDFTTGLGYPLAPNEDFWVNIPYFPGGPTRPPCPGCDASGYKSGGDPFVQSYDARGLFDRTYQSATIRYDHDFGFATLTSITNAQWLKKRYSEDSDASPVPNLAFHTLNDTYQRSEELRLAGQAGALNWLTGIYLMQFHTRNWVTTDAPPGIGLVVAYGGPVDTKSAAAFAQGEYRFSDLFSLIAGARYSGDTKKMTFSHASDGVADVGLSPFNPQTNPLARRYFGNVSGKIELDVRPNADTLLYASVNRGTKGGGFTQPAILSVDPSTGQIIPVDLARIPYDQEVLSNYELGYKLTLANSKLNFNGAAFHYDYHNYQAFTQIGITQWIVNLPATVDGFEMELAARPSRYLTMNAFATRIMSARVDDVTLPSGLPADHRRMPQAPAWSFGASASLEIPAGRYGAFHVATDWKYDTSQYFSTFNAPIDREPSHLIGDVRIGYSPREGGWDVAVLVNNVSNRRYRAYSLDLSQSLGESESVYAPPRWYSATVSYHF